MSETTHEKVEGPEIRGSVQGGRAKTSARARMRIGMVGVVFAMIFAGLAGRLAVVALGDEFTRKTRNYLASDEAPRNEVTDRNGILLATNLPTVTLEIAGPEVWDPAETAMALAEVLPDIDVQAIEAKLAAGRHVEVQTDLTPADQEAIFNLGLPGVRFPTGLKRFYPQQTLAAHIVGHTAPGRGGMMGLEAALDKSTMSAAGERLAASIDVRAQQALEDVLISTMEEFSAQAAWGGVMDVETGEVIALASVPGFNPNDAGASVADSRRNRAVYDRYELGSAFKAITAASVLEAGLAKEDTIYDARGTLKVADRRIRDFHGQNRMLTLSEVVQHSSNIGVARMAADLGPKKQKSYLKALGLFEALPIELPGNRAPDLPKKWGPVESATVSYGHGISVTPLHLLAAYGAIVNGGIYLSPTFIKVEAPRGGKRVFSEETSLTMRRVMRRVVTNGTASKAEAPGYYTIGKTATADKPANGGYDTNTRIASFAGAFPGYDPRYVMLVSFDDPQPTENTYGYATAGYNAAPAFGRLVERLSPIFGIASVDDDVALPAFVFGPDVTAANSAGIGIGGAQ